jgi:hypothetical protein
MTVCDVCRNDEAVVVVGDREGGEAPVCANCWHLLLRNSERTTLFKRFILRDQRTQQ